MEPTSWYCRWSGRRSSWSSTRRFHRFSSWLCNTAGLRQAAAGMFILLAKPFKINDIIDVAGESEIKVKDITTLFTIAVRKDNLEVLIPSIMIIGQKIIIRERSKEK
ncbi:MAG: mechanosensitive ion channel family protein [Desulfurococcaceae archaeon]